MITKRIGLVALAISVSNLVGQQVQQPKKTEIQTVSGGATPMMLPIDDGGDPRPPAKITAEVPVTYKGVKISGTLNLQVAAGYTVGSRVAYATIAGGCGNANGYGFSVGISWKNGNWGPSGDYGCQYPDANYCTTLARTGQSTDRTFYFTGVPNPYKPYYVYVTVDFGYNTDSKYWMYSTTSATTSLETQRVGYQFGYWSKRSTGGGDGYRLGPYLIYEVPTMPGQAGVKTLYERASSYGFGAPYWSSCLRSVELYEAIPTGWTTITHPFTFNVGLNSGPTYVDIPLWGLENKFINPDTVNLASDPLSWVTETKMQKISILANTLDNQYNGDIEAWKAESSALLNYEMPAFQQPSVAPAFTINQYEIVNKGNFSHLRVHIQ